MTGGDVTWTLFESAGVGIYGFDRVGQVVAINPLGAHLLGWTPSDLVGRSAHETFHLGTAEIDVSPATSCLILGAVRGGSEDRAEFDTFWRSDGTPLPVWWVAAPIAELTEHGQALTSTAAPNGESEPLSGVVVFGDASEYHARQGRVERRLDAAERGRLLAEAGLGVANERQEAADQEVATARLATRRAESQAARLTTLASLSELLNSLDVAGGLTRVVALVVEDLADGCILDRMARGGALSRVAVARHDVGVNAEAFGIGGLPRVGALDVGPLARVLRGQVTDIVANERETHEAQPVGELDRVEDSGLDALDAGHVIVTRLFARGQLLGAMTWTRRRAEPAFDNADRVMARLFGLRIGQWLENLRLNELQQDAALTLQRSLLTALPESDQLELVARYSPASEGAEVGGDWYDAVVAYDGHTVVAIGDVTGHDMAAAARMAQLRSVLRFTALHQALDPARTLADIDEAMPALAISGQASVVLAAVNVSEDGDHELIWSNAGHLPPVLIAPDGSARLLQDQPEPLLGLGQLARARRSSGQARRTNHRIALPAGTTVILYTDGLVERREEDLNQGLDRLVAAAGKHGGESLSQLCDSLLADLEPDTGATDDVAMIALRLHPSSSTPRSLG